MKLYVNGSSRTQGLLLFPKTATTKVTVRLGASTSPDPTPTPSVIPALAPFPFLVSPIASWQLGPVYFFEDLPASDMEVFLLYNLGPNYAAGLKSDMGLMEVFESFSDKNTRIF